MDEILPKKIKLRTLVLPKQKKRSTPVDPPPQKQSCTMPSKTKRKIRQRQKQPRYIPVTSIFDDDRFSSVSLLPKRTITNSYDHNYDHESKEQEQENTSDKYHGEVTIVHGRKNIPSRHVLKPALVKKRRGRKSTKKHALESPTPPLPANSTPKEKKKRGPKPGYKRAKRISDGTAISSLPVIHEHNNTAALSSSSGGGDKNRAKNINSTTASRKTASNGPSFPGQSAILPTISVDIDVNNSSLRKALSFSKASNLVHSIPENCERVIDILDDFNNVFTQKVGSYAEMLLSSVQISIAEMNKHEEDRDRFTTILNSECQIVDANQLSFLLRTPELKKCPKVCARSSGCFGEHLIRMHRPDQKIVIENDEIKIVPHQEISDTNDAVYMSYVSNQPCLRLRPYMTRKEIANYMASSGSWVPPVDYDERYCIMCILIEQQLQYSRVLASHETGSPDQFTQVLGVTYGPKQGIHRDWVLLPGESLMARCTGLVQPMLQVTKDSFIPEIIVDRTQPDNPPIGIRLDISPLSSVSATYYIVVRH